MPSASGVTRIFSLRAEFPPPSPLKGNPELTGGICLFTTQPCTILPIPTAQPCVRFWCILWQVVIMLWDKCYP